MAEMPDITLAPGTGGVEALAVGAASLADALPGFELPVAVVGLSPCGASWIHPRFVDSHYWTHRLFFSILLHRQATASRRACASRHGPFDGTEQASTCVVPLHRRSMLMVRS